MKLDLAPRLTHRARHRVTALVAATALISLAACSSGGSGDDDAGENDAASMSDYAADTTFKATEPVTFSMLWTDWPETPITDSWEIFDEIEERTNVSLDLTNIPFSDAVEKRSLLISSGDAPDIIPLIYTGDEQQFAASGAVLPLSDYEKYMPNFRKYVEEWDLGDMVDNLRQADGKYYMTPGLQEVSVPTFTVLIRKDIFDEVGAPIPETWDELRDGLVKIKAKYPDSTPLADGFEGASMLNYAAHAFGTVAGWGFGNGTFWDEDKGEFVYAATNDGYKDMVEYFHGLVEDGLLDTESFTAANDGSGTVTEKFAAGQVFAASGANGTVNDFSTALDATVGKGNYEVVQIAPPGGEAGQVVEPRNFWNGFMLTAEAKNHPNFIAMLQFLDWLYYSPEARDLLRWGVEGETYTKADGKYTLNPEFSPGRVQHQPGRTDGHPQGPRLLERRARRLDRVARAEGVVQRAPVRRVHRLGPVHAHAARPVPACASGRGRARAGLAPRDTAQGHRRHQHAAVHPRRAPAQRVGRLRRRARVAEPAGLPGPDQRRSRALRRGQRLTGPSPRSGGAATPPPHRRSWKV